MSKPDLQSLGSTKAKKNISLTLSEAMQENSSCCLIVLGILTHASGAGQVKHLFLKASLSFHQLKEVCGIDPFLKAHT